MGLKRYELSYGDLLGPIKTKTIKALDSCCVFVDKNLMGKIYKLNYNGGICFEYRGLPIGENKYEWIHCRSKSELDDKLRASLKQELVEARKTFGKYKAGQYFKLKKEVAISCALNNIDPPSGRRWRRRDEEREVNQQDHHAFAQAKEPARSSSIPLPSPNLLDVF